MNNYQKVRFFLRWNLIFSFWLAGCSQNADKKDEVTIIWSNDKPVGIFIPRKFVSTTPQDSIQRLLHIHLAKNKIAILGEYNVKDDGVEFLPVIPLTPGLNYEVYLADKLLGKISMPLANADDSPEVIAVYPTQDTLPENLLKFYIQFSKPMQEGGALDHIRLIKNNRDTLSDVFLDLQPELWDKERTILTLWLDPGRIKRGLQPNQLLGPPLHHGQWYQVLIEHNWQDASGVLLKQDYRKNFFTGLRDSISPDPQTWTIDAPSAGTTNTVNIFFHEPLDYALLGNTMRIIDDKANEIKGVFQVNKHENALSFAPASAWKSSIYALEIEPRLEDVAGNNLTNLFDSDLTQKQSAPKSIYKRSFKTR